MQVQTTTYVEVSEVFKGCGNAWEIFCESDPDCTWGSNNRTLVTPETIIDALEGADVEEADEADVEKVIARLRACPAPYVDLEN